MSYTLYYAPGAASFAVHWLLRELEVPFELIKLDLQAGEQRSPAYLALNPNGVVPTLTIDGKPMYECAALLLFLGDAHPTKGLAPATSSSARSDYLQWMLHFANTLQPAFRLWFYPQDGAGESAVEEVKIRARSRIESAWERVAAIFADGRNYLLGDSVGVADLYLAMLMRWSRNMPRPATDWPVLAGLAMRMKSRPSFKELYAAEGLTEWA